jgi:AbrB family looped-hinge helix DNA binding protein
LLSCRSMRPEQAAQVMPPMESSTTSVEGSAVVSVFMQRSSIDRTQRHKTRRRTSAALRPVKQNYTLSLVAQNKRRRDYGRSIILTILVLPLKEHGMRLTSKGQVTIPQGIRELAGLLPGSEVAFQFRDGHVLLEKVESDTALQRQRILATIKAVAGSATADRPLRTNDILHLTRGED